MKLALSAGGFEGPLDVLLALIRQNRMPIDDFPVAEVTRQYLDYLARAEQMDLELGAEFAYLAATLIELKSRSLLPRDPELVVREEDPRRELVRQLMERDQMQRAAAFLESRLGSFCAAPGLGSFRSEDFPAPAAGDAAPSQLSLGDVARLARRALESARLQRDLVAETGVTVEEMIAWLERHLSAGAVEADPLLHTAPSGPVAFLALLEMARTGKVRIEQRDIFGPIAIAPLDATRA